MQRNQYRLPARATGPGSQYSAADSVRSGTVSSLDSHGMHGSGDRMTDADRMTAASSRGGRGTGYSRAGDRMTCMTDDDTADMAPDMYPMYPRQASELGDNWEEQQRKWAGGRAPVATGPRQVEDFSEIEEADGGIHAERYGYAGSQSTAGGSVAARNTEPQGNFPTGPAAVHDGTRDSRDSNSSRLSVTTSGMQGGRRKPGQQPPTMPASLTEIMKFAPPEAVHGSAQEQAAARNQAALDDALSGKRFLNPAMRLQGIPEAAPASGGPPTNLACPADPRGSRNDGRGSNPGVQLQAPTKHSNGMGAGVVKGESRIEWERFPELSSRWCEQYEALDDLLQRLDASPQAGLNQATLQKRKKEAGTNKVAVTSEGLEAFPSFKDIPADAVALRDGRLKQILAQDLVPGDVVEIKAGHRVPADCRLLEASPDLRVEMATVGYRASDGTGPGHARDSVEADDTVGPWQCKNLVFMGCMCESGSGRAVVIKTGMHCALGVVAREMGWAQPLQGKPLYQKLSSLETAFEAQTERAARSLRLTNDEGRCMCSVM